MKKRVYGRKLNRERDSRRALFRSLVSALVEYGKINTTEAKAKAVKPFVDKLVNLAKDKSTASRRRVYSLLGNDKKTTKALFDKVAPTFKKRDSGFTRITKIGRRKGDDAMEVRMEWVEEFEEKKKTEKKDKKKKKSKSKSKKKKSKKKDKKSKKKDKKE